VKISASIEKLATDKRGLGRFFRDVKTWAAGLTLLKLALGQELRPDELELVRKATGLERAPGGRPSELYVIAGRRSGKSSLAAVLAVYMALFEDWKSKVSAGERPVVLIMAVDKSQAGIVKRYIEAILDLSASLRAAVKAVKAEEIELKNGVSVLIKPCSFRSIRGLTVVCAILEELAFWRYELESVSPDREVMTALKPALATTGGLIMAITTPYSRAGLAFETFKSCWGKPGPTLVWKAGTSTMNPTIDKGVIGRAMEEDPQAALAEYGAEFRVDVSGFLAPEVVEAAVIPGRAVLPPAEKIQYTAFLDPSGGRSDSFTMAIAHFDTAARRGIVDLVIEKRPPFNPAEVTAELAEVLKTYRTTRAGSDFYAAEWVSSAFQAHGIELVRSSKTKSQLYLEALPRFNSGVVQLPDQKRLISQLKALERKSRPGGRDQVDTFYPGSHDDLANVVCGALVGAMDVEATRPGRVFVRGERVSGPPDPPGLQPKGRIYFSRRKEGPSPAEMVRRAVESWYRPPRDDD